jgi:hypothetical protein
MLTVVNKHSRVPRRPRVSLGLVRLQRVENPPGGSWTLRPTDAVRIAAVVHATACRRLLNVPVAESAAA